jgi:enhancing lycopene biosynthesis protein 2
MNIFEEKNEKQMKKIGILLSGCGVYDGAEIQESIFAMTAIAEMGWEYVPIAIDKNQFHVVNHLTGEVMDEKRNMMVEAARITRGTVREISTVVPAELDALVIPGGFGSAKNFTTWAFDGSESSILPEVKLLLVNLVNVGKPIVALCVSPVVVAKALEDSMLHAKLTLGTSKAKSPYSISDFHAGVEAVGAVSTEKSIHEVEVDYELKIITAPCYMMDATILEIRDNIKQAITALPQLF